MLIVSGEGEQDVTKKEPHLPTTEDTSQCPGTDVDEYLKEYYASLSDDDKEYLERCNRMRGNPGAVIRCPQCGEKIEVDFEGFGWCDNPDCPWPRGGV